MWEGFSEWRSLHPGPTDWATVFLAVGGLLFGDLSRWLGGRNAGSVWESDGVTNQGRHDRFGNPTRGGLWARKMSAHGVLRRRAVSLLAGARGRLVTVVLLRAKSAETGFSKARASVLSHLGNRQHHRMLQSLLDANQRRPTLS